MDDVSISRITVENEVDWLRVQDNFTKSLRDSMETRLASLPGGKDGSAAKAVRKELEQRVKKVCEETFRLSKPNLRVNGHNYEDFVEATQPWDEVADRELKGLHASKVEWEGKVIERRRAVPTRLGRVAGQLELKKAHSEWLPEDDVPEDGERGPEREIPKPPRHQEVVDTFTTVASNLSELVQTAPAQLARAQRAHGVREEIANMGA